MLKEENARLHVARAVNPEAEDFDEAGGLGGWLEAVNTQLAV